MNFLEQLVAEWYEINGYFVRRNVRVGKLAHGGHEGELDVVAFHPEQKRLVHIESSMDGDTWDRREERFIRKFRVGRDQISKVFEGFGPLPEPEQIALFVFGSAKDHLTIGGGKVRMIADLMAEIREYLARHHGHVATAAIPEQYVILRALQFAANYWK